MGHDRRYMYLLATAQKRLRRRLEQQAESRAGISVVQAAALFALLRQDGALSTELASQLDIAPSAMTGLADRMLRGGLLERRVDEQDRRINRIWLTAHGREVALTAQGELGPLNQSLTEGFSDDEMAVVSRWLAAVAERFG
ncbi:MAG: MarR family winged helix-turn-helix transcriptional regulator [Pseudomonas sp.]|uniref:MarR family winged helix-turn-helix transcriptional regulator n=1 Tax=Pseudomonas sp. TaxID=306 RepID=UPI003D0FC55D